MSFRTFESPMDWEYQDRGSQPQGPCPSPFAKTVGNASFKPSYLSNRNTNTSPIRPFKPQVSFAAAPNTSAKSAPSAPAFRNPSFTTPQKRVVDSALIMSDFSGGAEESSPAMTDDACSMPADTPDDHDHYTDRTSKFAQMTVTPASIKRSLFGKPEQYYGLSGGGSGRVDVQAQLGRRVEQVRGKRESARKRKRQIADADVGAARRRLPYEPDDSNFDESDDSDNDGGSRNKKKTKTKGWLSTFLSVVSSHPRAPAILSEWLRLLVNTVLIGVIVYGMFAMVAMVRSDLSFASEKERTRLAEEIARCSQLYVRNHCEPQSRVPHMETACDGWESCMSQDVEAVMKTRVSARNAAEILNEFVGTVTYKTWIFMLSVLLIGVISSRIGFGHASGPSASSSSSATTASTSTAQPGTPFPSHPAMPHLFHPQDPNQAYILAPFATPHRLPRPSDPTSDGDDSPVHHNGDKWQLHDQRGRSPTKTPRLKPRRIREAEEF